MLARYVVMETLIENLLFFSIIILIASYLFVLAHTKQKILSIQENYDKIYEKGYQ